MVGLMYLRVPFSRWRRRLFPPVVPDVHALRADRIPVNPAGQRLVHASNLTLVSLDCIDLDSFQVGYRVGYMAQLSGPR